MKPGTFDYDTDRTSINFSLQKLIDLRSHIQKQDTIQKPRKKFINNSQIPGPGLYEDSILKFIKKPSGIIFGKIVLI